MDYIALDSDCPGDPPAPFVASYPPEDLDTEFKRKYPPDQYGKEMDDNARVWRVYKDEAVAYDRSMLDGWNKTLDILLIFAGLFSAVVTSFVVESYQFLQPDLQEYIANALYVEFLSRGGNASTPTLRAPSDFTASTPSRWINALWFTSLLLALSVALLCILVKQWLEEYASQNSKPCESARHWARRRALYFRGILEWRVHEFISLLPLALHLALFLFFAGIVVLLWSLDLAIATWMLTCTGTLAAFYATVTILPIWQVACPTSTPFLGQIEKLLRYGQLYALIVIHNVLSLDKIVLKASRSVVGVFTQLRAGGVPHALSRVLQRVSVILSWASFRKHGGNLWYFARYELVRAVAEREDTLRTRSKVSRDYSILHANCDELDCVALKWLAVSNSSPEVASVGIQSIAGLRPASQLGKRLQDERVGDKKTLARHVAVSVLKRYGHSYKPHAVHGADVGRDVRALLCLRAFPVDGHSWYGYYSYDIRFEEALACSAHFDLALISRAISWRWEDGPPSDLILRLAAPGAHMTQQFLTSTALHNIHGAYLPLSHVLQLLARVRVAICLQRTGPAS